MRLLGSVAVIPTGRGGRSAMGWATHLPSPSMEAKLLWRPSADRVEDATITRFARAVGREGDYDELWRWSVDDLEGFWGAVWEFFDVQASEPYERVLGRREMPGAQWFPGARLSYAEHFFRGRDDDAVAIRHTGELRDLSQWTWGELREQTARIAAGLRALGVGPGERGAGVRCALGDRSLCADRAQGPAGGRRLPLWRARPRSQRGRGGHRR